MKALFEVLRPDEPDWDLAQALDPERLPRHVAIIMDGNGRWAQQRNLPRVAGHRAGLESVKVVVETAARAGIQHLTLYAFSLENWKRPPEEVNTLWQLLHQFLDAELPNLKEAGIRLNVIGRVHGLPEDVREKVEEAVRQTENNRGLQVNVALNYGGRAEIVDAVNALLQQAREAGTLQELVVDELMIEANLYTAGIPDPDLLIRTSGEMRISNFLLWQIAYTELYVTSTLWPDFDRTEFLRALLDYQRRERRFGGISPKAKVLSSR